MIAAALFAFLSAVPATECDYTARVYGPWRPSELAKTDRGIRVRVEEQREPRRIADLYFDGSHWRQVIPADAREAREREFVRAREAGERCEESIPYERPRRASAIALRPHLRIGNSIEEKPAACDEHDGVIWFGLGFYEGEGSDGIGGIGRYDRATKKIEVRRPKWLRDKSIDRIAFDGHDLWLAVNQHYEKDEVPRGLVRYDWEHDALYPLRGDDAPCGFQVTDLLLDGKELWAATDLGLSRLDRSTGQWLHWTIGGDGIPRPGACGPEYKRAIENAAAFPGCEELWNFPLIAADFVPDTLRELIARDPKLATFYARAIGSVARNVPELRRILERSAPGVAEPAMLSFAERRSKEPEWRTFALAYAKRTSDVTPLRYLRGDDGVFQFVLSVADGGDHRRAQHAIEMLPWIGGTRAEGPLLTILDKAVAEDDRQAASNAIEALERAAHLRIEPDGKTTPLAADSDTPEYADDEDGAFDRYGLDIHDMRKIAAQWHQRLQI